ncbi:hypothetical protein [uncultured Parabacteroides sp.]|mgnify:CR=1 FL=1|uniref:hypothetical protein n=1 Tax=uncultured Parabacteroides sp. TaxID=512312 RepID=UPI00260163F5|nr:hypothetical protein [uncultured Parabacteroides sp.]
MKATKCINSKGLSKGAFIYRIKKDGTKSARPIFHQFFGAEKTAEEVIARLIKLNPNSRFEIA